MTSPTYQSDDNDPVMQMLRTGQVAPSAEASSTASASTPVASSDDSDPVMRMLRTGSADSGAAAAPAKRKYISPVDDPSTRSGQGGIAGNITDAVDATVGNIVQGTVGAIGGGYRGLVAWLRGRGMDEAADEVNNFQARTAYQPSSPVAEKTTEVMQSPWNPLNLPTTVGHGLGRGAEYLGAPPSVSATLEAVPTAASALYGMRNGVMRGGDKPMEGMPAPKIIPALPGEDPSLVPALRNQTPPAPPAPSVSGTVIPLPRNAGPPSTPPATGATPALPAPSLPGDSLDLAPSAPRTYPGGNASQPPQEPLTAAGIPRSQHWEPADIPSKPDTPVDTAPVSGGLPDDAHQIRAAILRRVGIDSARDSALKGDAMSAATDAQLTRFDEPAGREAKAQFDAEKEALQNHVQGIIRRAGGTVGSDEESLNSRGQTIAMPFDGLRKWFDDKTSQMYDQADERAGGKPITNLEGVDAILKDRSFRNTLMAKDQGGLLNSVENQLENFREQNPGGFTAKGAEQVRQWLNQVWTHDNRFAVGQLKDAIDQDVAKGAGEDIYSDARATARLKKQTLDNPNGVSQLFDKDPQTPLNRVTPFVKIPDTLTRLDPEQFRNVLRTLQEMPLEIQPQAQAAIGEIKGHLANKLLDAGTNKAPEAQWNAPNVNQAIKQNQAKLNIAFGGDAQAVQSIRDLQSAGNILRADKSYPGAAAQAANALKRGFMTHALNAVGGSIGAGVGSYLGGPFGGAVGAAVGERAAGRVSSAATEQAAVNRFRSGLTKLSDVVRPSSNP